MYKRTFYIISVLFFLGAAIVTASFIYLVNYYNHDLPDYRQLENYNPPSVSRVYSNDGRLITQYAKEYRIYIPFELIPKKVVNAFIAAEDQNYYSHPGIDYTSILRAFVQNILNIGRKKSLVGGSTITQQVVKNFLLTNEQTFVRKIKEAILSFRISQVYSKDKILELYLNQIFLGKAYGVAAAAQMLFNKSLEELSIAECAYLAALPKAPSTYNPKTNYARAKGRRDYVIDRMFEEKMITEDEAKAAINSKIEIVNRNDIMSTKADYFAEEVRRFVGEKYGLNAIYEGGLNIFTSLKPELQKHAESALREALISYDMKRGYRKPLDNFLNNYIENLKQYKKPKGSGNWLLAVITKVSTNKALIYVENSQNASLDLEDLSWTRTNLKDVNTLFKPGDVILVEKNDKKFLLRQIPEVSGSIIVMSPRNGKILAMSGGFDYEMSEFNRATQALRQPGSTFKPFVYLAALENAYKPNMILEDGPIEIDQGPGLPVWKPKNYGNNFLGPITFRTGLEKSRNTITVRLTQLVGSNKIADVSKRFGIYDNPQKNFAIALGSNETTLLKMTNAYATLANYGKLVKPTFIDYIQDVNGSTIYSADNDRCTNCNLEDITQGNIDIKPSIVSNATMATDERTAYQMISLLQGVIKRGTGQKAKFLQNDLFGKTGTSNDSKDIWFIGGNKEIVVGTYIGYDQPKTLGQKVTGATNALPVFVSFMQPIINDYNKLDYYVPEGITFFNVNEETGKVTTMEADGRTIVKEAFKIGNEPVNEDESPDGKKLDEELEEVGVY